MQKGGERWGGDKREGEGRGEKWEGREGQERGEGRYVILGFESLQNLKGTPFAICDFGKKPLGGHPLRSVTLGSEVLQNLSGTPLVMAKTFRGTPLAICDFGI